MKQALYEKYRPRVFEDIVGHEKTIGMLQDILEDPEDDIGGHAWYITGKSGVGKTTLARIMASMIADPLYIWETTGSQVTVSFLKEFKDRWATTTMFGNGGYALIVNESHTLAKPAIDYFLGMLEDPVKGIPRHVIIIFTTTLDGINQFEDKQIDAFAFRSQTLPIKLSDQGLCDKFAARAKEIAQENNLDGRPLDDYKRLMKECRNNMRMALNRIESKEMINREKQCQSLEP